MAKSKNGGPTYVDVKLDEALNDRMIEARRHLHRHPELSNEEHETQSYIRKWLKDEGVGESVVTAGTGAFVDVVGFAGPSNRKLAIRVDIDALPITEASGVPFSSVKLGVMHACGHDAHTAMGLATAALLSRNRDRFAGTVRLVFQPAEEAEPLGGRRIVLDEKLLEDVDGVIGIHVDPYVPTGTLGASAGSFTLASDIFDIQVVGRASHAAKPNEGVDAIAVGAAIVSEVQKLVSRETDAFDALIVSITGFVAGGSYNVLAEEARLRGTIRSGRPETRSRAHERLRQVATGIALAHRAEAKIEITTGEPSVQNDATMVELIQDCAEDTFAPLAGWTAADDFGFYSEAKPSVYFRLGIRNEREGSVHPLHHPKFRVDESAMSLGARVMTAAALRFLGRG